MAAIDDDDRPKKKIAHEIGQDLSLLSVEELAERVQLLHDEINRLEADMAQKRAKRAAADQFFQEGNPVSRQPAAKIRRKKFGNVRR